MRVKLIFLFLFFCIISSSVFARTVTLTWDKNSEPEIYCYTVYWGTSSGLYTNISEDILHSECGESTCGHSIEIPDDGLIYYFVVTASVKNYVKTDANIAIGTTETNIAYDAFYYAIDYVEYSKEAGEIVPGNDVIPMGLYGAIALDIGTDMVIDIVEAVDNATGYVISELAIDGLPDIETEHIRIGYVIVTKSDGNFIFGTTLLNSDNSNVNYMDNVQTYDINEPFLESDYSNEVYTDDFRKFMHFKVTLSNCYVINVETNGRRIKTK